MPSLTEYYGRARGGMAGIKKEELEELGEEYLAVAATGAGVALLGNVFKGLDVHVGQIPVPVDGLASMALGVASLTLEGTTSKYLKVASIAAGGSAAVRTFQALFKKVGIGGDFTDLDHDRLPGYQGTYGPTFAFGQSAQDRLVTAARYL